MLTQSFINWKQESASMLQSSRWYNPRSNVPILRVKHCDCFSVTNHKPLGNIWRLHLIKCNWGCGCQPKTWKGMIMAFPVQQLLFINQLCTGGISRHQTWRGTFWLHWGHSPANTSSREVIHTSKNIGWRLSSSILHHLLIQKNVHLCTEKVTSNNRHHKRLTSNPHRPCECIYLLWGRFLHQTEKK